MRSSDKGNESSCDYDFVVKRAERRILAKVQVISLLMFMFFSFLIYMLYLMIKLNESFTSDVSQWHMQALKRIDALEQSINTAATRKPKDKGSVK